MLTVILRLWEVRNEWMFNKNIKFGTIVYSGNDAVCEVPGQNLVFEEFVYLRYTLVWELKFRALGLIPSYKTM